jgi:hypothetical protein
MAGPFLRRAFTRQAHNCKYVACATFKILFQGPGSHYLEKETAGRKRKHWSWWFMSVITAAWEEKIRKISV